MAAADNILEEKNNVPLYLPPLHTYHNYHQQQQHPLITPG